MQPIDLFITSYLRPEFTQKTLEYLKERTHYPYRTFLIDNGGNEHLKDKVDFYIGISKNVGIMSAWNIAAQLAASEYFITSDNDIYVPDLSEIAYENPKEGEGFGELKIPCWLERMVKLMDKHLDYAAISLHPHVFIGIAGEDPNDPEDVKEAPMAGAVMRIMRTEAVRAVGGWEKVIRPQRNGEERWISGKLREAGWKVGRTTRIRAYHPFGGEKGNWGYPENITPEMQGHNPDLKDYVKQFDHPESYDPKTWLPKT